MIRSKKAARFMAARYERAINSLLKVHGYEGTVRIRYRGFLRISRRQFERALRALPSRFTLPKEDKKWERFAEFVNRRLAAPHGGLPVAISSVDCPECGSEVLLLADPCEWTRRKDKRWKVTSQWPAIGGCCDTLLTDDPFDGVRAWIAPSSQPAAV